MKAPAGLDAISMADDDIGVGGAYPPLGFRPVWNADLGNGDYFGLYWPYGREKHEPVVCDMLHDEWGLELVFSSVAVFVEWLDRNDGFRGDVSVDDPELAPRRFQEVKGILGSQPEEAVARLRGICEDFPERAEYWYALAAQLRRIGAHDESAHAAVRAFASNWVFGMPPGGTLRMLQNATDRIEDPLVARSAALTMTYGGTKQNANYDILKECIEAYLASDTPVLGLLLNQNYGYMMLMETTAFQDRYDFDLARWCDEHSEVCLQHVGDSRRQVS